MNRLKELRIEANESQEFVGNLIGVSGQAVGQYEIGKRGLSQDKIIILANHYNCTTDYLLCKSNVRNPENFDSDKIQIGLSKKDYTNITDEQKQQIEDFARYVLKDNKKEK